MAVSNFYLLLSHYVISISVNKRKGVRARSFLGRIYILVAAPGNLIYVDNAGAASFINTLHLSHKLKWTILNMYS